jgi:hypothetical protein
VVFEADNGGYEAAGGVGRQELDLLGDVSQRRRAISSAGLLRNPCFKPPWATWPQYIQEASRILLRTMAIDIQIKLSISIRISIV